MVQVGLKASFLTEAKHHPLSVAPCIKVLRPLSLVKSNCFKFDQVWRKKISTCTIPSKYITKTYFMTDLVV